MSDAIQRVYNLQDAVLLAHIAKLNEQLPTDRPTIEAEIPVIDQAFEDALKADYLAALEEGGDDLQLGEIGKKTQALLKEINNSQKLMKRLRFWVAEAYPDDTAKQKSFDLAGYWKKAVSQPRLITYMHRLSVTVQENRAELEAAGAPATLADDLTANAAALAKADAEQENSKGGRANASQARVLALNSLYARAARLARATALVYEDDFAKSSFYALPKVGGAAAETEPDPGPIEPELLT
jgi:prophage DNA circulation protein